MLKVAALCTALAALITAGFQSTNFSLSTLGGGVMGLANLWAWQRVVARIIAHQQESVSRQVHPMSAAAPLLLKFMGPAVVILVLAWTPVNLVAVGIGYGSTIVGMLVYRGLIDRKDRNAQRVEK